MEFLQSPAGLVALVVGAILALVTLVQGSNKLYRWLKFNRQGYPHEDAIEEALLPLLDQAIMAAYKASESLMDTVSERLHGADKAKVARLVYGLLPDTVSLAGVSWRWKRFVGEERFCEWLQMRFDNFANWWDTAEEGILEAIRPEGDPAMGVGGSPVDDTFRIRLPRAEPGPWLKDQGPSKRAWTPPPD